LTNIEEPPLDKEHSHLPEITTRVIQDEAGFTLVEIMIAAAIAFVVAFALAEVLTTTTRQEASVKMRQEMYNYIQQQKYENKIVAPPSPDP